LLAAALVSISILCFAIASFAFAGPENSGDAEPRMTGLPELTQEELQWQNKHHKRLKKVKLNQIGLKRVNEKRRMKGRKALSEGDIEVAPLGSEVEAAPGAEADTTESTIPEADVPGYVDNSRLKYFPPIRSQGSLPSCGSFSGTYYAMTHMWALANDLDAKTGGDDFRLSPKWNYNMVNGGTKSGSWYYWGYAIGLKHGTATWAEFPYDADYREWCLVPATWYNAIYRRFDTYGYVNNTNTDTGIGQVKQLLLNGYVLNIPTYIYSWQWTTTEDDPSTTDDDATVGKSIAYWVNGKSGYHAMTVVGYNDHIWTDIKGNGAVDAGEKGAFRIANSWGTGWGEGGFCWMAYDALKKNSSVAGAPSAGRIDGWYPARAHWVTARSFYEPEVVAEFTLAHAKRNQLRVTLGLSDSGRAEPSSTWYPQMIAFDGGAYAFDGTTTPVQGTFVFDFTDLLNTAGGTRWYLGLDDNAAADPFELSAYRLIDVVNNVTIESGDVPQVGDNGNYHTAVDYDPAGGNLAPTADFTTSAVDGEAPLTIDFDASASTDTDGVIVEYQWSFGDGAVGSGVTAQHTYQQAGAFTAVLTVTDDAGATASASVVITAQEPANQAPTANIAATPVSGQVPLTVSFDGSGSGDADGTISSYSWSFGDGSGDSGGVVDHIYSGEGQFTAVLTVTDDAGVTDSASVVIIVDSGTANTPPAVTITGPADGASFDSGAMIDFAGTASDTEDGDLTGSLVLTSDLQGQIGTGGSSTAVLNEGTHAITAAVTDSGGATTGETITFTVAGSDGGM
jgi:PKD repeat protein